MTEKEAFTYMLGRKLKSVSLSKGKERFMIEMADGAQFVFSVGGGCCSRSWIEHLEMPGDLDGASIISVHDSGGVEASEEEARKDESLPDEDSLLIYQTTFCTDRGDITLEYRNRSNGYYGGYLVLESHRGQ